MIYNPNPQYPNNAYNPYSNLAGVQYGAPATYTSIGGYPQQMYGYNGGYYSGLYGYNPYAERQRQEQMIVQQREAQRSQSKIFKTLYGCACSYQGAEVNDDIYNSLDPKDVVVDDLSDLTVEEQHEYYKALNLQQYQMQEQAIIDHMQYSNTVVQGNPYMEQLYNQTAKMIDEGQKKYGDIGMVEYFNKYAGKEYMEVIEERNKKKNNNVRSLYNPNDYNALLNAHKEGLFGNTFNPNANIDDQEVRLPSHISAKARQERRKRFLDSILANTGGMNNG